MRWLTVAGETGSRVITVLFEKPTGHLGRRWCPGTPKRGMTCDAIHEIHGESWALESC